MPGAQGNVCILTDTGRFRFRGSIERPMKWQGLLGFWG